MYDFAYMYIVFICNRNCNSYFQYRYANKVLPIKFITALIVGWHVVVQISFSQTLLFRLTSVVFNAKLKIFRNTPASYPKLHKSVDRFVNMQIFSVRVIN